MKSSGPALLTALAALLLATVPAAGQDAEAGAGEALAQAGATMDDVVKCTVFLADMDEWASMNEVYMTFFPTHRPARSAVEVARLARDARVEIECIAVLGAGGG